MRVLIIDNTIDNDSWGAEDLRKLARLAPGATISVRRAPERDLPASPRGFDRIILSGSKTSCLADAPWISDLHQLVKETLDAGIPYLGVCYGHQTLVRVLGGKDTCRKGSTPEFGWTEIEVTEESPLFQGLPRKFHTFASHFEEVNQVPANLRVFARSERCEVQAVQLENRPVFGIQFHPERDAEVAEKNFASWKKMGDRPVLHPKRSKELYNKEVGEKIFTNFLALRGAQ